jgi:hypothetical protein
MPHFKCVTCKTRVSNPGDPVGVLDGLCPSCGFALERAEDLAELVGFRALTPRGRAAHSGKAATHQSLVDSLGHLHERRALREAGLDGRRWGDEGECAAAEAVALPRPETTC